MSGQPKRRTDVSEGQTGIVTAGGASPAVQLDCECREVEVFSPAGYYWTPQADQRVLVICNRDEQPCIVGVKQSREWPAQVEIGGKRLDLHGEIYINGVPLETFILRLVGEAMGG